MVGSRLFLLSNPYTCCFLSLVALAEIGWIKAGETSEAIKTQLYYYGSSQLSLEVGRPPWTIR